MALAWSRGPAGRDFVNQVSASAMKSVYPRYRLVEQANCPAILVAPFRKDYTTPHGVW
jgi:hypothetical protein